MFQCSILRIKSYQPKAIIGRNIINFTDFPGMAQRKLINRRALRSNMSALTNLVSDEL